MNALPRQLVRYGFVPFMLIGLNGAAYYVVSRGHSYLWLALLLLMGFGASHVAEQIAPLFEEWNDYHGDEASTFWHVLVYETQNVNAALIIPLVQWTFNLKPGQLIGIWPMHWPILAQLLLAVVITDFGLTFLHKISHKYTVLWKLHAVHHGASRLKGFNGVMRHPLHQIMDLAIVTGPMALCGMPLQVAFLLGFVVSVQLIVQHSNVDAALGPLRNQLSIGRIHHMHHVNWGKEGDCNFGLFLTVWDRLFGTFKAEFDRPITHRDMGVDDVPNFPKSYIDHLTFPFRYVPGQGLPERKAEVEPQIGKIHPAE